MAPHENIHTRELFVRLHITPHENVSTRKIGCQVPHGST